MARTKSKTAKKAEPLAKPEKQTRTEEFWDYYDVCRYIEKKYKISLENYAKWSPGKNDDKPYQNFWHWITDRQEIHNGCFFYLNVYEHTEPEDKYCPGWVKEILKRFYDEFGEDEMRFWVAW